MRRPDFGEVMGLLQDLTGNLIGPEGIGRLSVACSGMQGYIVHLEGKLREQAAAARFSPDQRVWYRAAATRRSMAPMPAIVVANAGERIRVRLPAKSGRGSRVCQVSPASLSWVENEQTWAKQARALSFPGARPTS